MTWAFQSKMTEIYCLTRLSVCLSALCHILRCVMLKQLAIIDNRSKKGTVTKVQGIVLIYRGHV